MVEYAQYSVNLQKPWDEVHDRFKERRKAHINRF
jgi:hypothetical protein